MVGFWIFMLIMLMLIPGSMIFFGNRFRKASPKNINYLFGYRTSLSMKNRDTWEFAHYTFGKLWFKFGMLLLVVSAAVMLFQLGEDVNTVGNVGLIVTFLQCIVMVIPIFMTEHELKQNFDQFGRRK